MVTKLMKKNIQIISITLVCCLASGSALATVWADPDFDAKERAFYYARVLEIPTPPWYLYDVFRFSYRR
jgi:hypothetical protein